MVMPVEIHNILTEDENKKRFNNFNIALEINYTKVTAAFIKYFENMANCPLRNNYDLTNAVLIINQSVYQQKEKDIIGKSGQTEHSIPE